MQSLRDKLLQAGLVTNEQADKAEAEKKASASRPAPRERRGPPPKGGRPSGPSQVSAASESRLPKLPPLPGSKEYQRRESAKQHRLDAQLRELVHSAQVPVEPGDHTFFFVTRKGRLRRMEMSPAQAKQLEEGQLAVVERPEPAQIEHSLVPPETAEKMHALHPKSVRFFNKPNSPIGFLSEQDISQKQEAEASGAAEAAEREQDAAEAASAAAAPDDGGASDEPSAETGPWIAVKRAPPPSSST